MKQENQRLLIKTIGYILTFLCVLIGVVYIGGKSLQDIKNSQYVERVESSNLLMEKISQNITTAINFNWQSAHHTTELIENVSADSVTELLEYVKFLEQSIKETSDTRILLIDTDGYCHMSDESTFKWFSLSMLNNTEDQMYISKKQFSVENSMQMHYLAAFKEPLVIDDITFTHISLVCNMNELDTFFNISNYGENSVTFIIHRDGSQVYREEKENNFSGIYNILSTLKKAEFGYGKTYEDLVNDIDSRNNDSIFLTIYDTDYYACYYTLDIMDWVVLLLAPAELVSGTTQTFTEEIIFSVLTLCAIFLVILLSVITFVIRQFKHKQIEINDGLKRVAEAERRANEAKTNFLSSMSHDIRTPMNAITGMVMLASNRVEDTNYIRDCLEKIGLASDHLLTLINNILDISKVESGKMMLNPDKFSLTECFSNLINIMQPQIKEHNQELFIYVHNVQHENLYGDKLRLNQIFINLFSNAIKYTQKEGKISVDLYQEPVEDDNKVRIIYVVQDNGMGMSREFQETMYESFSRAADTRTNKTQGSGLGLAICKQMVELMGGTIECESELGVGTTFTVTIEIPIADTKEESLKFPEMNVLLVDDDEIFLETATATLESLGLKVKTLSNAGEVISELEKCHHSDREYSLVLIDKKLPDGDGISLVQELRSSSVSEVPVIIISAYDASLLDNAAKEAGANGVITKPFFRSKVYDSINEVIGFKEASCQAVESDELSLEGIRLLVVEDNDMNWEIAHAVLEMQGIIADRAEDGQICINMMKRAADNYYSLVLMDVRMPVMDGREATRILRKAEKEWIRNIPIVAMTADAFAEDVQECLVAGMNEHIAKPLDMDRLLHILRKFCTK